MAESLSGASASGQIVNSGQNFNADAIPGGILKHFSYYVENNQSVSTPIPFDQRITVDSSLYKSYESSNLQNVEWFTASGAVIPSWIENNASNSAKSTTYWLKFEFAIPSNSTFEINIGFVNKTISLFSADGVEGTSPLINPTTDNGPVVFSGYYSGFSITGWSTAGNSGIQSSSPTGSPAGTWAFYALNSVGNYLYRQASAQSKNMILEYYTYDTRLNDVFFLVNSQGQGQYSRVGDANGTSNTWYGIGQTTSWVSWGIPQMKGTWQNRWLTVGVVVNNSVATEYLQPGGVPYGNEIGKNPSNSVRISDNGNYIGLVGDAHGTSYEYWNGIIIRPLPPDNVMPGISFYNNSTVTSPPPNHQVTPELPTLFLSTLAEKDVLSILIGIVLASLVLVIEAMKKRKN